MSIEKSQALKRLIRKYEFLLEDWRDVEEISKTANVEMMSEVNRLKPADISEDEFTKPEEEPEKKIESETENDIILKKLFRKIVFKCHPDSIPSSLSELERAQLISLYDEVVEAHDTKNWALMIIVAIKLEVQLPVEAEEMVGEIETETKKLEEKINQTTSSVHWQYYHAEREERERIVNNYLNLLNQIKESKNKRVNRESKLILGIGHPRTGTGYTAKLLRLWGLDVGHERMGEDGIVAWQMADSKNKNPIFLEEGLNYETYTWLNVIYCVRDPKEAIASIAYTEGKTLEYRAARAGFRVSENPLEMAINSLLKWDEMCLRLKPGFIYRIEDQARELFDELKERVDIKWVDFNKKVNVEEHDTFERLISEWDVSNRLKNKINEYSRKYGYSKVF